jgi:hypothetical protein
MEQHFGRVYTLDRPRENSTGGIWSKFFSRVHSAGWTVHLEAVGDVSGSNFFSRIDQSRGGIRGSLSATFFVAYIGWTGKVETVN